MRLVALTTAFSNGAFSVDRYLRYCLAKYCDDHKNHSKKSLSKRLERFIVKTTEAGYFQSFAVKFNQVIGRQETRAFDGASVDNDATQRKQHRQLERQTICS
ncbi:hypothetical protein V6Z11_D11G227900 [Gossypium hirsutum]